MRERHRGGWSWMLMAVGGAGLAVAGWRGPGVAPPDLPRVGIQGGVVPQKRGAPESYRDAAEYFGQRAAAAERALGQRPTDARLLYRIACWRWQRAYLVSLDAYTSDPDMSRLLEIESDPTYQKWMARSLARDATGDLREAARAARRGLACERDPQRRWWLLRQLARIECFRGRHEAERDALRQGARLRPNDPDVLGRLSRAEGEVGDLLARENALERVWRLTRAQGAEAPPAASIGGMPGGDAVWASTAPDGDDWIRGLCTGTGARARS